MLQQYQLARNTMRDELVQKLDMPTCDVYDLCGTLAIYVLGNKLTCIIPASRTKATPERRWSIEHDAGLKYCCCDTQQDLLILVELEGEV